jgi:hypothetical protein
MTEAERVATRAKPARLLFIAAFLVLAGLLLALFLRGESTRQAACVERPAGKSCQRSKRESDRARSVRDTCISFWKVGYACPAPDSGVTIRSLEGGGASQPAHAGQPTEPAPAGGNEPKAPDGGADTTPTPTPSAPTSPASEPAPPPAAALDPVLSTACSIADHIAHLC